MYSLGRNDKNTLQLLSMSDRRTEFNLSIIIETRMSLQEDQSSARRPEDEPQHHSTSLTPVA